MIYVLLNSSKSLRTYEVFVAFTNSENFHQRKATSRRFETVFYRVENVLLEFSFANAMIENICHSLIHNDFMIACNFNIQKIEALKTVEISINID